MTRANVDGQRWIIGHWWLAEMLEQTTPATIRPGCVNTHRANNPCPDKQCCCDLW